MTALHRVADSAGKVLFKGANEGAQAMKRVITGSNDEKQ